MRARKPKTGMGKHDMILTVLAGTCLQCGQRYKAHTWLKHGPLGYVHPHCVPTPARKTKPRRLEGMPKAVSKVSVSTLDGTPLRVERSLPGGTRPRS